MTNTPDRLSRIESILDRVAAQQEVNTNAINELTTKLDNLSDNVSELTENTNRVLARSAVLDDVFLELRENHDQHQRSFEQHQQNFIEHQRTTNAALQSLEAILLQLIRIFPQQ